MGKTFKDLPPSNKSSSKKQPYKKEGRRFVPSKGRKPQGNLKDLVRDGRELDDYFI